MRGVDVKENPILSILDRQIMIFFENVLQCLKTDFSLTFEIVTTMQKDSLLDLLLDPLLNPFLALFDPPIHPLLDLFLIFYLLGWRYL